MGIVGLLPFLKKIHSPVNVSQYEGCTVAIDAYCWLHKGAFACADKLAMGEKTDQYVFYCLKFINYLLSKNIKPIMVLDGCHLPSKKDVETSRREKREVNRKKAAQFLREGKRTEARECLQRCIDVTPQMALELINACRAKGVDCIVAPYEADSQLAYLSKTGIAQLIITEDSDLLLFGCERILFKMDHQGNGMLIEQRRLNEVLALKNGFYSFDKFRYMCILSGCDYLPSLSGIGLVKANKVFKSTMQTDVKMVLKKLPTYIKLNEPVTPEYTEAFIRADNTFLYQLVFDPRIRRVVPLNPYPDGFSSKDMPYAGSQKPREVSYQISLGNIDIYTNKQIANFDPDKVLPRAARFPSHLHPGFGTHHTSPSIKDTPLSRDSSARIYTPVTFPPSPPQPPRPRLPSHLHSIWHPSYKPLKDTPLKEKQVKGHASTTGQEITVDSSAIVRGVKKKRRSSEVENEPVIQDSDLSDIYSSTSSPSKRPKLHHSPTTKPVPTTPTTTQKLGTLSTNTDEDDTRAVIHSSDDELPSPNKRAINRFSVKSSSTRTPTQTQTNNSVKSPLKSPENLTSPRQFNRFAVKSPEPREKFNVNAVKVQVKSRFFAKSTQPSSLLSSLDGVGSNNVIVTSRSVVDVKTEESEEDDIHIVEGLGDGSSEEGQVNSRSYTSFNKTIQGDGDRSSENGRRSSLDNYCSNKNTVKNEVVKLKQSPVQTKSNKNNVFTSPINQRKSLDNFKSNHKTTPPSFSWSKFTFANKPSQDVKSPVNTQMPFKSVVKSDNSKPKGISLDSFCRKTESTKSVDSCHSNASKASHREEKTSTSTTSSHHDTTLTTSCRDNASLTSCHDNREDTESIDVIDLSQDEDDDVTLSSSYPETLDSKPKVMSLSQPNFKGPKNTPKGPSCRVSGLRTAPLKQKSVRDMLSKFASPSAKLVKADKDEAIETGFSPFFRSEEMDML